MYKWRLKNSPICDFSNEIHAIGHYITECETRKFGQGIEGIHEITPEDIEWINDSNVCL